MAHLVLTIVGEDRPGLVQSVADAVAAHGGNWERSELAELAGAFAGIVLVSVPLDRAERFVEAVQAVPGLRVGVHHGRDAPFADSAELRFTVLGNDRPGIVREISAALAQAGSSIVSFASHTREAPMAGGELFEADIVAHVPAGTPASALITALEHVAGEIQVDLAVDSAAP